MKITVRTEIEIEGAQHGAPVRLAWQHVRIAGDNPRFYGHEVIGALAGAAAETIKSAEVYVNYDSEP